MAAARDLSGDPPGSTFLRIGDDMAWSDAGAVYDRDDSLTENTNPKCMLKNHPGYNGNGASQRFSGNLKPTAAPIIGISGKLGQGGGGACARRHHPPAMFPKKANTGGGGRKLKTAVPEPGSPKVSCIGRVQSKSERERSHCRPPKSPGVRGGCYPVFGFFIRRSRSKRSAVECVDWSPPRRMPPASLSRRGKAKGVEVQAEEEAPAPALGGMRRFASGRRAAGWAVEMELDGRVAKSGPL